MNPRRRSPWQVTRLPKSNIPMSRRTSSTAVALTNSTFSVSKAADLILHGQRLRVELDSIIIDESRTHVRCCCFLQIRVAKFKDDFRVAYGKAIDVVDAPAQNKSVVVEAKVLRIHKEDFPNLGPQTFKLFRRVADARRLSGAMHDLAKIAEVLDRSEALSLKDDFALEVMNVVQWMSVTVGS
jgi:hypothetical protein